MYQPKPRRGLIQACEVGNGGAAVHRGINVPNVRFLAAPFVALVPGVPPFGYQLPGTVGMVPSMDRSWCFSPSGGWQPRHVTSQPLAQIQDRGVQVLPRDGGPQVQRVAAGPTGKTVPRILAQMGRERAAGGRLRPVQRTATTPLLALTRARLVVDQLQDVSQA